MSRRNQSGFTLVEIAVVLVIIGVLLGGVLQGAQLIENAKVKKAVAQINGITAAFHAYKDRYNALPGDNGPLAALQARGGDWALITAAGNNDGSIWVHNIQTFVGSDDNYYFWQHLKAAGFINGDPSATFANALPVNPFNGLIGVVTPAIAGNLTGVKICLSKVPGGAAIAIDHQLDDGVSSSGRVRAIDAVSGQHTIPTDTAATAYNETNFYTLCTPL